MRTIGVVITGENLETFVGEAIASVLAQTRGASEIVVVEDSTDGRPTDRLNELGLANARVLRTAKSGSAAARNVGIAALSTDYVVVLDADHRLLPTYLEITAERLDHDSTLSFVTTAVEAFGDSAYQWTPPPCSPKTALTQGTAHPASLFRRDCWTTVGGFDENATLAGCESLDFWLSVMLAGLRGVVVQLPLLHYRTRADSASLLSAQTNRNAAALEAVIHKHRAAVAALGPDLLVDKDLVRMEQEAHLQQLLRTRPAPRITPVILMYHRVGEVVFDPFGLSIPPAQFETQMRHLHRYYCPMSLSDLRLAICQDVVPEGGVAVTIDDGYVDSLTEVSPVLLRHRIPATFFVTAAAESEGFWWDEVAAAIHAHPRGRHLKWLDGSEIPARSPESLARWLRDQLVPLTRTNRDRATDFLRQQFEGLPKLERDRRLTSHEVKALSEQPGHTIGSHTVNHLSLPDLDPADRDLEIHLGRTALERLTSAPVRALAYPFGRTDAQTVEAAIRAGVVIGVTTAPRPVRYDDSPWLLPRVDASVLKDFEKDLRALFSSQP